MLRGHDQVVFENTELYCCFSFIVSAQFLKKNLIELLIVSQSYGEEFGTSRLYTYSLESLSQYSTEPLGSCKHTWSHLKNMAYKNTLLLEFFCLGQSLNNFFIDLLRLCKRGQLGYVYDVFTFGFSVRQVCKCELFIVWRGGWQTISLFQKLPFPTLHYMLLTYRNQ